MRRILSKVTKRWGAFVLLFATVGIAFAVLKQDDAPKRYIIKQTVCSHGTVNLIKDQSYVDITGDTLTISLYADDQQRYMLQKMFISSVREYNEDTKVYLVTTEDHKNAIVVVYEKEGGILWRMSDQHDLLLLMEVSKLN